MWADLAGRPAKVAAVGVRTERAADGRRRTLHGVALNVDVDLAAFAAIVPCGIPDKPVASLASLGLGVTALEVEERLGVELDARFGGPAAVAAVDRARAEVTGERPLLRRLRRAGVDPDAGLPIATRKPEWLRVEAHMGPSYQGLREPDARPQARHRLRGGGLPEHLRVLGQRHGHVHGQRRALHARLRLLPGRHAPPAAPRPDRARPRRRGGRRASGSLTR